MKSFVCYLNWLVRSRICYNTWAPAHWEDFEIPYYRQLTIGWSSREMHWASASIIVTNRSLFLDIFSCFSSVCYKVGCCCFLLLLVANSCTLLNFVVLVQMFYQIACAEEDLVFKLLVRAKFAVCFTSIIFVYLNKSPKCDTSSTAYLLNRKVNVKLH